MKHFMQSSDDGYNEASPTQQISAERVRAMYDLTARLSLSYEGVEHWFTASSRVFVVGRNLDCDLVVAVPVASRHHARFIYRKGKFVVIDQSTNGTYVQLKGNDQVCLLNGEEFPLVGEGVISLGRPVEDGDPHLIHFRIPGR
ncbi:hypothetical protein Tgr7_1918 [Thioalkalivibrio sulfidiphilus HL-EbGr7]|uniref:FHA domain-containing protein n=2 Tax=Thioalkalivibrio TaxID=106633 RepID=B8GSY4_THISH|nr:hypothetical protein Tgr7_1918 [Thioalkalivibrio sulfidiphilus HL-EbGr7]